MQQNLPDRCHCRPVSPLQVVKEYCHIEASEITMRLPSGVVLHSTEAHPEPREIHNVGPLGRRQSRSSVDTVEDQRCHDLARALPKCVNSHVCEIKYRLGSEAWFEATGAHPEPREIHNDDPLACRLSPSLVDTVEDSDDTGTASKSGQARHGRATKRKRVASCHISASRKKRRPGTGCQAVPKPDDQCEDEDSTEEYIGAETELLQVRVDDLGWFYVKAFRLLNQLCCRDLLKAWIAFCHPQKQSRNPYNGGKKAEMSIAEYGEKNKGQLSKPDYWPSDKGLRHTEPDHLHKNERLVILAHLLQCEDKGYKDGQFYLESLIKSTDGIDRRRGEKLWTPSKLELLEEIYRVRRKQRQYERDEIDGDTLVSVQMPKPRCKKRKARKSAVKAAKASRKPVREESEEPEQRQSSVCTAPVAKMYMDAQLEDEREESRERSETKSRADTTPSTEEVSCPEQISNRTCTVQRTSPSFDSPGPKDTRHGLAQEDWSQSLPFPSPYDSVTTLGEPQMSLPLRGRDHSYSSMHIYPSRDARRNENTLTAHPQFVRSPQARPIAAKVETVRYPALAGSSSGLSGVWPTNAGRQLEDHWSSQAEASMFTDVAEPSASFSASTSGSFSSGYGDANMSSVPQLNSWNGWSQPMMQPHYQSIYENTQRAFGMQTVGTHQYPYERSDVVTPSGSIPYFPTSSLNPPNSRTRNSSSATEHNFGPFTEHQRQF